MTSDSSINKKYLLVATRAEKQNEHFCNLLKKEGFDCLNFPVIAIRTLFDNKKNPAILNDITSGRYDWLVFTSSNAVYALKDLVDRNKPGSFGEIPDSVYVAAVGSKTSELFTKNFKKNVDIVPAEFLSESLIKEFEKIEIKDKKFLIIAGTKTRDLIKPWLLERGGNVESLTAYENTDAEVSSQEIKKITEAKRRLIFPFFSPSAVNSLLRILGPYSDILRKSVIVSIGPVTSNAIRSQGFEVTLESKDHSESGMLVCLKSCVDKLR